jgi:hypothetical protein
MLYCIEMGWFVLDKYYILSGDTPVYAAALLLDPSKRTKYIERNWDTSWHAYAIDGARKIWEEEYNIAAPSASTDVSGDVFSSSHSIPNELAKLQMEICHGTNPGRTSGKLRPEAVTTPRARLLAFTVRSGL